MCRNWIWDRGISQVLGWYNWKSTCPSTFFFFYVSGDITYLFYELVLKVFYWMFSHGLLGNNKHGFTARSLLLLPWAGFPTPSTHIFPFSFSVSWIQRWVSEMIWKSSMWVWASNIQLQIFSLCCQRWCWNEIQCELYVACYLHACGNNIISYVIELNNGKSLVSEVFHIATAWNQRIFSDLLILLGAIFK